MVHNRQAMVDKMRSWLGCHEGDATHKHIIDVYNSQKPLPQGYKVKYTDAWCATTVSSAAIECGYTDIIPTECSCNRMIKLLQQKGIWVENDAYVPKLADIIFYDWDDDGVGDDVDPSEHVGLVEQCVNNQIKVVEGNKNDGVNERTLQVNGKYIRGYGVPKYDDVPVSGGENTETIDKNNKSKWGVDISSCQSSVDFNRVKASGCSFVILRSTTKNGKADTKFEKYYNDAKKAGLTVTGVYKYSYAVNEGEAKKEAEGVIKLLNGRKCDIWLDLEDKCQLPLGKDGIARIATTFLTTCVNAGYDVGIYCNLDWYNNYIKEDIRNICRFWIARYGKNTGQIDNQYKPNCKGMVMWQYTSKGKVDGISGYVDMNIKC